jgi:hypothetical protein
MYRSSMFLIALLILPAFAGSQEAPQVRSRTHEVVRGETLWDLADRYLGNPFRWPLIYEANTDQIRDPDLIFPGQQLLIPGLERAVATVEGVSVTTQGQPVPSRSERVAAPVPVAPSGSARRTVFYQGSSPGIERGVPAPETPIEHSVSSELAGLRAVPVGLVYGSEWLDENREGGGIGTWDDFARVVAERTPRGPARVAERMVIVPDPGVRLSRGDLLQSFRTVRRIEGFGYVQKPTGILVVTEIMNGRFQATVSSEFDRISEGDRVRLAPEDLPPVGVSPLGVESNLVAIILDFAAERPIQGLGASVFLDVGSDQGIAIGDVFQALVEEAGPTLGSEAARLQVTLVQEDRSTARVISVTHPTLRHGNRVRLVEKMPG